MAYGLWNKCMRERSIRLDGGSLCRYNSPIVARD